MEKSKTLSWIFLKSLHQSFLKFNDTVKITKQLVELIERYYLENFKKSKKISWMFFKTLEPLFLKFKDPEAISKQLMALIERE